MENKKFLYEENPIFLNYELSDMDSDLYSEKEKNQELDKTQEFKEFSEKDFLSDTMTNIFGDNKNE